jgi:two-component system chemotaxis response regulator CheB
LLRLIAGLETDPDISVMGVAAAPYIAAERMEVEIPDVITLDIEMPRLSAPSISKHLSFSCWFRN